MYSRLGHLVLRKRDTELNETLVFLTIALFHRVVGAALWLCVSFNWSFLAQFYSHKKIHHFHLPPPFNFIIGPFQNQDRQWTSPIIHKIGEALCKCCPSHIKGSKSEEGPPTLKSRPLKKCGGGVLCTSSYRDYRVLKGRHVMKGASWE